jgi:signal transduction histidine kinase
MKKKHLEEKHALEFKNARLSALFAELDPDPLIRIDETGKIIHFNDSASLLLNEANLKNMNIGEILQKISFDPAEVILEDKSIQHQEKIGDKFFTITIKGIKFLNIAQIYFHDITERKKYEDDLKNYQQKLRDLSRDIQNKTEEERKRIAGELHDSVGQQLSLLKLKVQQVSANANGKKEELLNTVDAITNEVRAILYQLRPKILDELGLGAAVTSLVESINEETNIKSSIRFTGNDLRYNPAIEMNLYRIIQEALNNIIKHSHATEYFIQILFREDSIKTIISDDGVGFELNGELKSPGYGMINMKERIESLNGTIKIDSNLGEGTVIIVELKNVRETVND